MKTGKVIYRLLPIVLLCLAHLIHAGPPQSFDEKLLEVLNINPGMIVADLGAGNGKFSIMLARQVGPEGHVYANEIDQDKIEKINKRKRDQKVENLTTILGGEEDPRLPVEVDFMVMKFVFHHLSKPDEFTKQLLQNLNPGGRLAVIAADINTVSSYRKNRAERDACISDPEETRIRIEKCGFVLDRVERVKRKNEVDYVLVFRAAESMRETARTNRNGQKTYDTLKKRV